MTVNVEKISSLEYKLNCTIAADKINADVNTRLKEVAKTINIPGFRPGKVPFNIVESKYKDVVLNEILEKLINTTCRETIEKENFKLAQMPHMDFKPYESGKDYTFEAKLEVLPEVKLSLDDFPKIKVEKMKAEITDGDLDEAVELFRKQHATWKETTETAKMGDEVVFTYNDDKQERAVELGRVPLMPEFERAFVGAKAGDVLKVSCAYPKDFYRADLAEKNVAYNVIIKAVKMIELPEVNEEFIKKFGIESGEISAMRDELRKNMENELTQVFNKQLHEAIAEQLITQNSVELPKALVVEETDYLKRLREAENIRYAGSLPVFNLKPKGLVGKSDADIEAEARKHVANVLLLDKAVELLGTKLDQNKFSWHIWSMAMREGVKMDGIAKWRDDNPGRIEYAKMEVLREQALEELQSKVTVNEKTISYKEAVEKLTK